MKLDSRGRPPNGPNKLKLKRLKQQIPLAHFIKQELMDYYDKKLDKISNNEEIANKFSITKRKLSHYLSNYQIDTENIVSKSELKIRKRILGTQRTGKKNPFYGRKHSEESRNRIKLSRMNRASKEFSCIECGDKIYSRAYKRLYCSKCKKENRKKIMRRVDLKRNKNPKRILQNLIKKRKYNQSEKARITNRNWRKNTKKGKLNTIFNNSRRRERLANVKRGYTKKEWFEKVNQAKLIGVCPKCKRPFTDGARSLHQLTMDHNPPLKKAPKGFIYTIECVEPICFSCNAKKQDKS